MNVVCNVNLVHELMFHLECLMLVKVFMLLAYKCANVIYI